MGKADLARQVSGLTLSDCCYAPVADSDVDLFCTMPFELLEAVPVMLLLNILNITSAFNMCNSLISESCV